MQAFPQKNEALSSGVHSFEQITSGLFHGSTPQGSLYGNLHLVRRIYNSTAKIATRKPANFRKEVRTTEEEPAVADGDGATDIACFASTGVSALRNILDLGNNSLAQPGVRMISAH
jgi:hypothetical protein